MVLERKSLEQEGAIRSRHSSPELLAEEPKKPSRKLGGPSVDQRPARRRRLGRPALEDIVEGSVDGPAEQRQSRRTARARAKNAPPSSRRKKRLDRTASSANPARASSRIAVEIRGYS